MEWLFIGVAVTVVFVTLVVYLLNSMGDTDKDK